MAAEGIRITSAPLADDTKEVVKTQNEKRAELKAAEAAEKNNVLAATSSGADYPQAGDKRSHDGALTPAGDDQATDAKKPKTEGEKPAPAKATAPATNGEKKRPGRPPKKGLKETIKKKLTPRSAEGIGSRTRSRVKLTE